MDIVVDREGFEELGFTFWGDTDYAKVRLCLFVYLLVYLFVYFSVY